MQIIFRNVFDKNKQINNNSKDLTLFLGLYISYPGEVVGNFL